MKDWLAIGFMSAVFLAFLGLCGTLLVQRIVFVSGAEPAMATVTRAEYESEYDAATNRPGRSYYVEGSYTFDGETYESTLLNATLVFDKPAVGESVEILVDTNEPKNAQLWRGWRDALRFLALPVLLVLLPSIGAMSLGKKLFSPFVNPSLHRSR